MTKTAAVEDEASWYIYVVRCRDGSLYTGIARDVARRVAEHNHASNGAKYTRARRPVQLVYCETAASRSEAARREHEIKRLPAHAKRRLVAAGLHSRGLAAILLAELAE